MDFSSATGVVSVNYCDNLDIVVYLFSVLIILCTDPSPTYDSSSAYCITSLTDGDNVF